MRGYRGNVCRGLLAAIWFGCSIPLTTTDAIAQTNPRSASSEVLDGMVRSLIESRVPNPPRTAAADRRVPVAATDAQIREVRANLAGLAQELSQLVGTLYQDVNRTPGLRSLMGEALQVNATATLLSRQSAAQENLTWIAEEYRALDQAYRLLAFRLRELRNLSPTATRYLQRADEYQARLGQTLRVNPQLDRDQVMQQAAALATDVLRLVEEIDYEVADARTRYDLLLEGRRVYQQSRRISMDASQASSLEDVRGSYDQFQQIWEPLAARLRPLQLRLVDRQLQRVEASERSLQELLMLPVEVNRAELLYLTQILQRDLDQLMDGVTLRHLTALTQGRDRIIGDTNDFYAACGDFAECVRSGETPETMAQLYDYLDSNWQRVANILKNAEPTEARQVYRQLDRSVNEIREILAVPKSVDRERIVQLGAELENLAARLEFDIRSSVSARPTAYPAAFRTQCVQAAQEFRNVARQLNAEILAGQRMDRIRELTSQTLARWNVVLPYLDRFPGADRDHLYQTRRQIAPALVDLQAMTVP